MPSVSVESLTSPGFLCGLAMTCLAAVGGLAVTRTDTAQASASGTPSDLAVSTTTTAPPVTNPGDPVPVITVPEATAVSTTPPDITPPTLAIAAGLDGSTVTTALLIVSGTSEVGAVVSVGSTSAPVDDAGNWVASIDLVPGPNSLAVTATDVAGNVTAVVANVIFTVPPATTTTAPKKPTATTRPPTATTRPPVTAPPTTTPATTSTTLPVDTEPG